MVMEDFQCLLLGWECKAGATWLYFLIVNETKQVLACFLFFYDSLSYFLFCFLRIFNLIVCEARLLLFQMACCVFEDLLPDAPPSAQTLLRPEFWWHWLSAPASSSTLNSLRQALVRVAMFWPRLEPREKGLRHYNSQSRCRVNSTCAANVFS